MAGEYGILINLVLMVLNLVPIPPLDGSRVISALLPKKAAYQYGRIEPFGIWILIALLAFKILHLIIFPPIIILSHFIHYIFALPKIFLNILLINKKLFYNPSSLVIILLRINNQIAS